MDRPLNEEAMREMQAMQEAKQIQHTPHLVLNPAWLPPAVGFAHVVVPASGLLVFLGGQAGHRPDGALAGETLIEQFDQACGNLVEALAAAGGAPDHLVSIQIFVTEGEEYRSKLNEAGDVWRRHFGKYYPAMALLEVKSLLDPGAKIELMGIAVVPDRPWSRAGWPEEKFPS